VESFFTLQDQLFKNLPFPKLNHQLFPQFLAQLSHAIASGGSHLLDDIKQLDHTLESLTLLTNELQRLESLYEQQCKVLAEKHHNLTSLQTKLTEKTSERNLLQGFVKFDQEQLESFKQKALELETEGKMEMDAVVPPLEDARKFLLRLTKKDISEVKSFTSPPTSLLLCIDALGILLGRKSMYKIQQRKEDLWNEIKPVLNDPHLIPRLVEFDRDTLKEENITRLKAFLAENNFNSEIIDKLSVAGKAIYVWLRAVEKYFWAAKAAIPRQRKLEDLYSELKLAQEKLGISLNRLTVANNTVNEISGMVSFAEQEYLSLKATTEATQATIERASTLLSVTNTVKHDWIHRQQLLQDRQHCFLGDSLMFACQMSLFSFLTLEERQKLKELIATVLQRWSIAHSSIITLSFIEKDFASWNRSGFSLCDLESWVHAGLPNSQNLIEAAVTTFYVEDQWPLLLDPQSVAKFFLRKLLGESLIITTPFSIKFMDELTHALTNGQSLMVEMDEITDLGALNDLILKKFHESNAKHKETYVRIHGKAIPIHPDFKLYFRTSFPILRGLSSVFSSTVLHHLTPVQFGCSFDDLEKELLETIFPLINPQKGHVLGQLQSSIITNGRAYRRHNGELLSLFAQYSKDTICECLEPGKTFVPDVSALCSEMASLSDSISKGRTLYETEKTSSSVWNDIARRWSLLWYSLKPFVPLNKGYHFSIRRVLGTALNSLLQSKKSLETAVEVTTEEFVTHVGGAMHPDHVGTWLFLLGMILKASSVQTPTRILEDILHFSQETQNPFQTLTHFCVEFPGLHPIKQELDKNDPSSPWVTWYSNNSSPALLPLPETSILTPIEKMMAVWCLKPNMFMDGVLEYGEELFGSWFSDAKEEIFGHQLHSQGISPPSQYLVHKISRVLSRTSPECPIVIWNYTAHQQRQFHGYLNSILNDISISLGFGVGRVSTLRPWNLTETQLFSLLETAIEKGNWVIIEGVETLQVNTVHKLLMYLTRISDKLLPKFRIFFNGKFEQSYKIPLTLIHDSHKLRWPFPRLRYVSSSFMAHFNWVVPMASIDKNLNSRLFNKVIPSAVLVHSLLVMMHQLGTLQTVITSQELQLIVEYIISMIPFEKSEKSFADQVLPEIHHLCLQYFYSTSQASITEKRLIQYLMKKFYATDYFPSSSLSSGAFLSSIQDTLSVVEQLEEIQHLENTCAQRDFKAVLHSLLSMFPTPIPSLPSTSQHLSELLEAVEVGVKDVRQVLAPLRPPTANPLKPPPTPATPAVRPPPPRPYSVFFTDEMVFASGLLETIKDSLTRILLLLQKKDLIEENSENRKILEGHIPTHWMSNHPFPFSEKLNLREFITLVLKKASYIIKCAQKQEQITYSLSGFFHPQRFLEHIAWNHAVMFEKPLPSVLRFEVHVLDHSSDQFLVNNRKEGVTVMDVALVGAQWLAKKLRPAPSTHYQLLPPLMLIPNILPIPGASSSSSTAPLEDTYPCPLYVAQSLPPLLSSHNFVANLPLATSDQSNWQNASLVLHPLSSSDVVVESK
jgi:hypothetical protein